MLDSDVQILVDRISVIIAETSDMLLLASDAKAIMEVSNLLEGVGGTLNELSTLQMKLDILQLKVAEH